MSRNDFGLRAKSFGGSVNDRYFSRLYNDWRNMFININKKTCFLIFFQMFLKHVKMGWQFQATLKLIVYLILFKIFFFRKSKHFKQVTEISLNNLQLFFHVFHFLISVSFISVNSTMNCNISIWYQWLCFIINIWLRRNNHFQWKKYIWLVNNPLFSVLGCFHLSQSEICKDLTKIPTSVNVSKN